MATLGLEQGEAVFSLLLSPGNKGKIGNCGNLKEVKKKKGKIQEEERK